MTCHSAKAFNQMNRVPNRTVLSAAVVLLGMSAVVCVLWCVVPGYYHELDTIRGDLQQITQVENVDLRWVEENDFPLFYNLKAISARIQVTGKGEIAFCSLTYDSTRNAKHLYLSSVGPFSIRFRGEEYVGSRDATTGKAVRSEFAGCSPDIGPDGAFAHLFPFEIPNIQAAVDHYDEILRRLEDLAATPAQPRSFQDAQGTLFYYWVVASDGDASEDPLWNQPLSALRANAVPSEAF